MRHSIWPLIALIIVSQGYAASTRAETTPTFSSWTRVCKNFPDQTSRQVCITGRYGQTEPDTFAVAAVLIEPDGELKKTLRIALPLGMQISPGTRVIADSSQPLSAPYVSCHSNGCMADYDASSELVGKLRRGQNLWVQGINTAGQSIGLAVPLGELVKALDGPPVNPKVLNDERKKALDVLQSVAFAKSPFYDRSEYTQLVYSPWTKFCLKGNEANAKNVCFTGKNGRIQSGVPVAQVVLIEPEGQAKKILRVTLPLGMQLQQGVHVTVDQDQPLNASYVVCFTNGCMADFEASNDLIGRLKRGHGLAMQGIDSGGQSATAVLPLSDFANAYNGPPTSPKVVEAEQKRLQDELEKRAEASRRKVDSVQPVPDLSLPAPAAAQQDEAAELNARVIKLFQAGNYSEAIPLAQRALAIREKALGSDHPDVAQSLNNLAALYLKQGRYADAEPLYKRLLAIREKALGPDHPDVARALNNLAELYQSQGRYADAEPLFKRSLAIREKALGPDHPDVATALNNLAGLYDIQGAKPTPSRSSSDRWRSARRRSAPSIPPSRQH